MDNEDTALENSVFQSQVATEKAELKIRSLTVKRWLRTGEIAIYLGTTQDGIKKLVARKRLVPKKLWGRNYFDREQVDNLIENSAGSANAQPKEKRWR